MGKRNAQIEQFKKIVSHKAFKAVFNAAEVICAASFIVLLTADCFHVWQMGTGNSHTLAAYALAVSSYFLWMWNTFWGVGYLYFLFSMRTHGIILPKKKWWRYQVHAVGYSILYAIYIAWGMASVGGNTSPKLGALSVSSYVVYIIAYIIATVMDKISYPPFPPRRKRINAVAGR